MVPRYRALAAPAAPAATSASKSEQPVAPEVSLSP
jgi:hypothetical protein